MTAFDELRVPWKKVSVQRPDQLVHYDEGKKITSTIG
jgi:hypothetical protein